MENKNTIIAVVLMLAVWIGFSILFPPQNPPPAPEAPVQQAQSPPPPSPSVQAPGPSAPAETSPVELEAPKERNIRIETDLFAAVLSTSGARIVSLELKDFSTEPKSEQNVFLVKGVPPQSGSLRTSGAEGLELPADALYYVDAPDHVRIEGDESREIVFRTRLASGLEVEKIFVIRGNKYETDLRLRATNRGMAPVQGAMQVALVESLDEGHQGSQFEFVGPSVLVGDDVEEIKIKNLEEKPIAFGSNVVWTGFVDMYFIKALVPLEGAAAASRLEKSGSLVLNHLITPTKSIAPGESVQFNYLAYFGPKDLDILKAVDHRLAEAIDYGIFSFLALPLLHVLKFFYTFLGNYGLAIILLTVIIKLLFWPLTQKSYASMKAMQKLQPQMQKIREKYKNDRDKMNREVMELYKNNRVNPLGGCLPMLVQIPVFFALYKVLLNSIELRHAPFYLWIHDLAAKDPYYITPLVMGATMFIQQKMTPTTMDPMQARIFLLMPVIFTFMFLNFPSGLVIYWLVNNVLTIGQQYLINRKVD